MIKTRLVLDMNRKAITPHITAKQIDSGRIVEITVNCDGVLVTDIFDETRILTAKGENSFYCSSLAEEPVVQNLTNGKTIWKIPSDVLKNPGITIGELCLLKNNDIVSSMPFEIDVVEKASQIEGKIPQTTIDFIIRAENAARQAEQANQSAAECRAEVETKLANGDYKGDIGPQGPQGVSGVYLGSGEMPEGYDVQIDPTGEPIEVYNKNETDSLLQNKIALWRSSTEYRIGDCCIAPCSVKDFVVYAIFTCIKEHISDYTNAPNYNLQSVWDLQYITAIKSYQDILGNVIHETYATKEEIVGTLGTINEVLATLVEVE